MKKMSWTWKMVLVSGLISCQGPVDDESNQHSARFSGSSDTTLTDSHDSPPTFCGSFGTLKQSFDRFRDELQCTQLQDNYIAEVDQRIRLTDIDVCCECFFPGTICPSGQKLKKRSRCDMMNEDYRQRFEDAVESGVSAMYCPKPQFKDIGSCCEQDEAADNCPDDPNKVEPGICGCGTPDVDSDGDGVLDCNEEEEQYCGPLDDTFDGSNEHYADTYCCLCGDCWPMVSDRGGLVVDADGTSCGMLSLEMTNPSNSSKPGTETCRQMQIEYRDTCCNPDCTPRPAEQEWEPADPPLPQGDQPRCDLCYPYDLPNAQYPTKPYTITAVLGMSGNPTCKELYWMGRMGHIEGRLCYPLQNYMEGPCGCTPPQPEGNEPWCDLCPDGQYPLRPTRQPDGVDLPNNPTCSTLYWMGRKGEIPSDVCAQLQTQDARGICGCLTAP